MSPDLLNTSLVANFIWETSFVTGLVAELDMFKYLTLVFFSDLYENFPTEH